VRGWKSQITRQTATISAISKMLGYSDAYLKAHPPAKVPAGPPPPLPDTTTHTYGGDVTNSIGAFLHSVIAPFARGGHVGGFAQGGKIRSYDKGGMMPPGLSMSWNGLGHPEPVGAQATEITLHWDMSRVPPGLDQQTLKALRYEVKTKGGGSVQRTFGVHGKGS
jgi:hypothetical protein